jgi:hypothetical protein
MTDEELLWEPALTLLVGAELEHFLLVPGNLGIDLMRRYGLFLLRCRSAIGLVLRLRLGALGLASGNARTCRLRGIGHGSSSSLIYIDHH